MGLGIDSLSLVKCAIIHKYLFCKLGTRLLPHTLALVLNR